MSKVLDHDMGHKDGLGDKLCSMWDEFGMICTRTLVSDIIGWKSFGTIVCRCSLSGLDQRT